MPRLRRAPLPSFTLVELLVVIGLLALVISILLPTLNRARQTALKIKLASEAREQNMATEVATPVAPASVPVQPSRPLAQVSSFNAKIDLTPRLSVGTAEPESIYSATMEVTLLARNPAPNKGDISPSRATRWPALASQIRCNVPLNSARIPAGNREVFGIDLPPQLAANKGDITPYQIAELLKIAAIISCNVPLLSGPIRSENDAECEIQLPLPPQIISLADLALSIDGRESDEVQLANDKLIWHGPLPHGDTPVRVQYTAVGRGIYSLLTPPGKIIDQFKIELAAHGSDVRMMELSLQPTSASRASNGTMYVWDYKHLLFGRPIALDVLGIAPIDRLGELSWLGPISVIALGIVIGVISRAYAVANFDRWMLLLVLGTFTGAYPLMYFAQQFIPLYWAMAISAALVLSFIATRVTSIMGWKLGLLGVTLPAAVIMAIALDGAVHPQFQGILLTALALGLFVLAMLLAPRIRAIPETPVAPALA